MDVGAVPLLLWRVSRLEEEDGLNDEQKAGAIEKLMFICQQVDRWLTIRSSYRVGGEKHDGSFQNSHPYCCNELRKPINT